MKAFARFLCVLSLTAFCVACITPPPPIDRDPSFTYSALVDAGLGIGGVTSLVSDDRSRMEISNQMASMLRRALMARRRGVNVVPWGEIRRRLGDEEMSAGLQSFEKFGDLAGERLSRWDARLQGSPGYVVLARVEEDITSIDESDHEEEIDDEWIITGVEINATRSVIVAFNIYDIRSPKRVWAADIERELENTRVHEHHDGESREPPDPPSSEAVIKNIFDRFAGLIPGPGKD